tara:strand:- start:3312 stop:4097 length:786 start_codon:yes stop_codon:yes gene_type:complete
MVNITEIEKYRILRNHNLLVTEQDKSKFEKKVDKAGEKVEKEKYGELIEFASDKVVDAMNLIKGFEKKVKGREPLPTLNPTRVYTDLKKLGVTEFFIYLFRDITQYASVVMFLKSFLTEDCDTVKSSVPEIGEVSMEELINIISSENKEVFKIIKKAKRRLTRLEKKQFSMEPIKNLYKKVDNFVKVYNEAKSLVENNPKYMEKFAEDTTLSSISELWDSQYSGKDTHMKKFFISSYSQSACAGTGDIASRRRRSKNPRTL